MASHGNDMSSEATSSPDLNSKVAKEEIGENDSAYPPSETATAVHLPATSGGGLGSIPPIVQDAASMALRFGLAASEMIPPAKAAIAGLTEVLKTYQVRF